MKSFRERFHELYDENPGEFTDLAHEMIRGFFPDEFRRQA